MIRINLLRDRRAARFAKALLGEKDTFTMADLHEAIEMAESVKRVDDYVLILSPEQFQQIKGIPGMSVGTFYNEYRGVKIKPSHVVGEAAFGIGTPFKP